MFNDDYILKIIEGIGNIAAKLLSLKDNRKTEIKIIHESSDWTVIQSLLARYLYYNKYNEAENLLYKLLEGEPSEELFRTGFWFYDQLSGKTDKNLASGNFTRDEIQQGIEALKRLKVNSSFN